MTPRPQRALSFPSRLLLATLRAYQAFLSPLSFGVCKFHPSCSRYAAEAIERHGARRGAWLALHRLWRCRPLAPGGHDPVPDPEEAAHSPGGAEVAR